MPQVPDSFVPSATTSPLGVSPYSATPVDPMRNAAPGQMQQSGADTQKLGEVTNDIGERIQNQLDNAMAKQAETGFIQKVMAITNGDGTAANPGYLNLKGQDAINGLAGAQAAIVQAKADSQDGLADDFQKSMYNRVASQHLLNFGRQMSDHSFQQLTLYSGESAVNRASANAGLAIGAASSYGLKDADGNPTGDFAKYLGVAEKETLNGVQIMKGQPAGSAMANAALMNLHSQIAVGVLSQMVDSPQDSRPSPSRVQAVLDDMKATGFLQPDSPESQRAIDTLGKMVKSYSDGEVTRTVNNQALADAQRAANGQPVSSSTPDPHNPIKGSTTTALPYDEEKGGVELTVPQNSAVQAPADGTVTGLGRNDDGVPYLELTHKDGSVSTLTGLNAFSVKVGDQVKGGENIATSGVSDSPRTPSVLWSMADKNGNVVDPTKAGLAPVNLHSITDEKVLDAALSAMRDQIPDQKLQDQAASEMTAFVKGNQHQADELQTQLYKQASDAYAPTKNWRSIPNSLFSQLSPERQQEFKDDTVSNTLKVYEQGQRFKEMSETDIVTGFDKNPATLTQEAVDAARPNLADATYRQLTDKAAAFANNPKGVIEAQAINDRVKYFAGQSGLNVDGSVRAPDGTVSDIKATPADKDNYRALMFNVNNDIDRIKAQNHGKATSDQVDKAIQNELIQRTFTLTTPRPWPLSVFGPSSTSTQKQNFQVPAGAVGVGRGNDGKMHYVDGSNSSLGPVQ